MCETRTQDVWSSKAISKFLGESDGNEYKPKLRRPPVLPKWVPCWKASHPSGREGAGIPKPPHSSLHAGGLLQPPTCSLPASAQSLLPSPSPGFQQHRVLFMMHEILESLLPSHSEGPWWPTSDLTCLHLLQSCVVPGHPVNSLQESQPVGSLLIGCGDCSLTDCSSAFFF